MDTAKEIAASIHVKETCGLKGGLLVTNPIPEEYAMNEEEMTAQIDKAVNMANEQGIKGKEITPFLLDKIKTLTEGRSLEANIKLVLNNARLGAAIAKELSNIN